MEKIINKNFMYNFELQSLHHWFKNISLQNPSTAYNNIFKIIQNNNNKTGISNIININSPSFSK